MIVNTPRVVHFKKEGGIFGLCVLSILSLGRKVKTNCWPWLKNPNILHRYVGILLNT